MTIRKNITLTEQQDTWVKSLIAAGDYTNESEYFRDLLRRDQQARAKLQALRKAIDDGVNSGVYEGDAIADIRRELGLLSRNG